MSKDDFIFSPRYPYRLYRHTVFWMVIYFFSLLTYLHPFLEKTGFKKWMILQSGEVFLHIVTEIMFSYLVIYSILPLLYKKRYTAFGTGFIFISLVIILIYWLEHIYLFRKLHAYSGLAFMSPAVALWFTAISFLTYFPCTTALLLAIKMLKNWYLKQKENQVLVRENANAELQLLKAQVHPHFLFNTLNNIYAFTLSKSPEASSLVSKLSGTVHYMITDCNSNTVLLGKELKMLEDYIGLEQVRYGERLEISSHITTDSQRNMIAPLLMIPFVENCFKHGSSVMRGRQWIQLSIQVSNDTLMFDLRNSKPVAPLQGKDKNGIGLPNVKKRLTLLYPGKHQLAISATDDVYHVHMEIELQQVPA